MQIAIHTGVHQTECDVLSKALLRNRDNLQKKGVVIPGPGKYRRLFSQMLNAMEHAPPVQETREVLLDNLLDNYSGHVDRLVLSHENFFSVPKIAFEGRQIYRKAENRLKMFEEIFRNDTLEIFISIRNPATFLSALLTSTPHENLAQLMYGLEPADLLWSKFAERVSMAVPNVPLHIWCYEDSPFILGKLIRKLTTIEQDCEIIGAYSRFSKLLSQEGEEKFREVISSGSVYTEKEKQDLMVMYFEKYALAEEVYCELDVSNWTQELIEELTQQYDQDLMNIEQLPNVSMIYM